MLKVLDQIYASVTDAPLSPNLQRRELTQLKSIPISGIPKKISSKSGKFSLLKILPSNHHNPPSIHYKLTTNSPSKTPHLRPTPFKKAPQNQQKNPFHHP
jgi:predicted nucleic acid binding AN1-type Zn finger protein